MVIAFTTDGPYPIETAPHPRLLRLMIHSKFAEAAPHAVLSQVPQDRTRVLFCTRWTGAISCRHLMQQFVELAPLARPQRM